MDHLEGPLQLERASPLLSARYRVTKALVTSRLAHEAEIHVRDERKEAHHFMSIATQPLETTNSFLELHRESEVHN